MTDSGVIMAIEKSNKPNPTGSKEILGYHIRTVNRTPNPKAISESKGNITVKP